MYAWLTDPVINYMAHVGEVTLEGQRKWFESLPSRDDYWIRGIVADDGQRLGTFGLKHIDAYAAEVFSYIGPSERRGAGVGRWSLQRCEDEARRRGMVRLWGIVAAHNDASRRMLRGLDYVAVGTHEDWGIFIEKLVPGRELTGPP
jgi:RimJ/RimL family protein N-acetyltransferase